MSNERTAAINNETSQQMAKRATMARIPFMPTAPFTPIGADTATIPRFYTCKLQATDSDYNVNSAAIRRVSFDIPCRLCIINGAAFSTAVGNALPVGVTDLNTFLISMSYSTGEKLMIEPVLASTVLGKAQFPGQIGASGWTMNPGSVMVVEITPLLASLNIHIVLQVLELRGAGNTVSSI